MRTLTEEDRRVFFDALAKSRPVSSGDPSDYDGAILVMIDRGRQEERERVLAIVGELPNRRHDECEDSEEAGNDCNCGADKHNEQLADVRRRISEGV